MLERKALGARLSALPGQQDDPRDTVLCPAGAADTTGSQPAT